jgi:hypothetical protein
MKPSASDLEWLRDNYPDLQYQPIQNRIVGELAFRMYFNPSQPKNYVFNPGETYDHLDGVVISDVYEISIHFQSQTRLPDVFETGGRITASARKWDITNMLDLHVYPDNRLCLCIPLEIDLKLPHGFNLPDFFANLLIPYFYYQAYIERTGKEPWRGYGHGEIGILESYYYRSESTPISLALSYAYFQELSLPRRQRILRNRKFKSHDICLCGTRKRFRNCHPEAQFGFNALCDAYRRSQH